jgi:hypothetical protein
MIRTANIATAIALIAASIPLTSAQPGGTKRVEIVDRVFNRTAYTYAVPATWSFQGAVIPGTRCDASPSPVFRTSSQDGMTGEYFLPRVDWFFPNTTSPECALWRQMISAREFLTYMVGVLRVGFVREEDIGGDIAEYRRNIDKMNAQFGPTMTVRGDMAKFLVRYELNGRAVDEWVSALVQCSESVVAGMRSHFFRCGAYTHAPTGAAGAIAHSRCNVQIDREVRSHRSAMESAVECHGHPAHHRHVRRANAAPTRNRTARSSRAHAAAPGVHGFHAAGARPKSIPVPGTDVCQAACQRRSRGLHPRLPAG